MKAYADKRRMEVLAGETLANALMKTSTALIVGLDTRGRAVLFSRGAERITGWKANDAIGKDWFSNFLPANARAGARRIFRGALARRKEIAAHENLILTRHGERRILLWGKTVTMGGGRLLMVLLVGDDVTDIRHAVKRLEQEASLLKAANSELNDAKDKYVGLVNNIGIGVFRNTPGPKGHFIEVNPAFVRIFEAGSRKEILKRSASDLYQDPAQRKHVSDRIVRQGVVRDEELELVTLKGRKFWALATVVMKRDGGGNAHFDGVVEDITERKRAEETLRQSEERMSLIFNNVRDGIVLVDNTGKVVRINNAITRVYGYTEKDLVGKRVAALRMIAPGGIVRLLGTMAELARGKESTPYDIEVYAKDGSKRAVNISGNVIRERGRTVGIVSVLRDITERKRAEEALRDYDEKLAADVKNKTKELGDVIVELEKKNKLLENFKEFAINRENELIALRKEVKRLRERERERGGITQRD